MLGQVIFLRMPAVVSYFLLCVSFSCQKWCDLGMYSDKQIQKFKQKLLKDFAKMLEDQAEKR